jgi:archaellum component FlaC
MKKHLLLALTVFFITTPAMGQTATTNPDKAQARLEQAEKKGVSADAGAAKADKNDIEHAVQKQKEVDSSMIKAVNQVPGVDVDEQAFKNEKKKGSFLGNLNPFKWIFKPVTDMQDRIVHLEKNMMRMQAPMAALNPPIKGLRQDMTGVSQKMKVLHSDVNSIYGGMGSASKKITHIENTLGQMYEPVVTLKKPVEDLAKPINGMGDTLAELQSDLKELKNTIAFTNAAILIALIGMGLVVMVGTPVAAIIGWRHRHTIADKLDLKKNKTGGNTAAGELARERQDQKDEADDKAKRHLQLAYRRDIESDQAKNG